LRESHRGQERSPRRGLSSYLAGKYRRDISHLTGRTRPTYTIAAMATLLEEIRLFCETHNMPPTRFGDLALNDKPFVAQLESGRRGWPENEAKVRRFMATYKPDTEQDAAA